jgi:sugar phosphate isomerase/epimerase
MHRFGVSTHLFHGHRLQRDHLAHVAAHGFEAVELFATRSHFDYRSDQAIGELQQWLADTRLSLHSVHAPIVERIDQGRWIGSFSNASTDDARRRAAVAETEAALAVATRIPFSYLVVHLGMPAAEQVPPGDNDREAALRSIKDIVALADGVGVRVALEVIPNPLSSAEALALLVEEHLEGLDVGVCLDYGHAHLMGDLGEAIEALSGHLWTTHVHDNHGVRDDHLTPYSGAIDWDAAMMETQKIGYDGVLMLEVSDTGDPLGVLEQCVRARKRLERASDFAPSSSFDS